MSAYNTYGTSYSSFSTMGAETVPAAEKVRRHPKYYLNGADIHFLVENYIFRVHRYFFERESSVFREKLNIPPAPGQNPRGTSDSNPIPLDDVREVDFSRFLWVFYNPKYSIYDANVDEWSSILKLAYDWRFPEVKRLASRYLEKFEIDPVQKIELYQWYELDKRLLIPSYVALINRQEPLSIQEGRRLTLETSLLIATARECARGKPIDTGKHSPTVASVPRESMIEIIKEVFGLGNTTPASPSLEPIWEGAGPSAFSATPMSPSKIITSPPRDGAMSHTPSGKSKKHSHSDSKSKQPAQPEMLTVEPNALLPGQSPTKPDIPSIPPYLANVFSPPTPPGTIKASKSTDSKESKDSKDSKESDAKKNGSSTGPAGSTAAGAGNTTKTESASNQDPARTPSPAEAATPASVLAAAGDPGKSGDTNGQKEPPAAAAAAAAFFAAANAKAAADNKSADANKDDASDSRESSFGFGLGKLAKGKNKNGTR